jgi:hypothetical protein
MGAGNADRYADRAVPAGDRGAAQRGQRERREPDAADAEGAAEVRVPARLGEEAAFPVAALLRSTLALHFPGVFSAETAQGSSPSAFEIRPETHRPNDDRYQVETAAMNRWFALTNGRSTAERLSEHDREVLKSLGYAQ